MVEKLCSQCGSPALDGQMVCNKCGSLLFDPKSSTIHMRVDPSLLELRRRRIKPTGTLSLNARIIHLQIRGITERLAFEEGTEIVLGRIDLANPDMSRFDLTRYGGHERGVSREHAVLRYEHELFSITDLRSANGTMVNTRRLRPNEPRVLSSGDEIVLGSLLVKVRFEPPKPRVPEPDDPDEHDAAEGNGSLPGSGGVQ